jgi:hypothetical protein
MGSGRTHPHLDRPTEADLNRLVESRPPEIRRVYLDTHRLVLEAVPDIEYSVDCVDAEIGYGARQFGFDGWGMAALSPYAKWVTLVFVRAAGIPDPEGLLQGKAPETRHIKIRSLEELDSRREAIGQLLKAAASKNQPSAG